MHASVHDWCHALGALWLETWHRMRFRRLLQSCTLFKGRCFTTSNAVIANSALYSASIVVNLLALVDTFSNRWPYLHCFVLICVAWHTFSLVGSLSLCVRVSCTFHCYCSYLCCVRVSLLLFFTCVVYEFYCHCSYLRCVRVSLFLPALCTSFTVTVLTCVVYEFHCYCSYLRCVRVSLSLFLPVLCTSFTATVLTCVVYEFHGCCSHLCRVRVPLLLVLPVLPDTPSIL